MSSILAEIEAGGPAAMMKCASHLRHPPPPQGLALPFGVSVLHLAHICFLLDAAGGSLRALSCLSLRALPLCPCSAR